MTDNRTTELRKKLTERGVEYEPTRFSTLQTTFTANGIEWIVTEREATGELFVEPRHGLTPEQAIAATLGSDDEYEAKMDALLCRLTNGKWSKSRAYDLDFMEQCINEEFETLYAEELADAELGNGTLTAEQVRECVKSVYFEGYNDGSVNRGQHLEETDWQAIADELSARAERTCENTNTDGYGFRFGCSECGYSIIVHNCAARLDELPNYCPNCGRKIKQ